ncbi:MAG: autotransporter outer membrane beta-barrel domain-containing protein, partial [Methylobacillus sp.]|nr:autotransporter outer membrane beta-barrel domain-containing protein [Methylobacillus sp.]
YAALNWWHAPDSQAMNFGPTHVKDSLPKNLGEAKLGVEGHLSPATTVWSGVGTQFGSDYRNVFFNLGLKYSW